MMKNIKKDILEDPRTTKDLFVDRYGAVAISDFFKIKKTEIEEKVNKNVITLIEIYNPDFAECLLKSIPIKDLTKDFPENTLFYKVESSEVISKYNIKELPALLVFKNSKLLGQINGYYTTDQKDEVIKKLKEIIS